MDRLKKFGYKDFIPMFTGKNLIRRRWAALFKAAGAKFAGPVGEHHDGFSMWDTTLNPWNSKRMGPGRDVVGELARAIRAEGMKIWWHFTMQRIGAFPSLDKGE